MGWECMLLAVIHIEPSMTGEQVDLGLVLIIVEVLLAVLGMMAASVKLLHIFHECVNSCYMFAKDVEEMRKVFG